jgi:hypothetical protein
VDHAVEAYRIGNVKRVVPPLLIVVHEAFGIHQSLQVSTVLERCSRRVGRVRSGRKGVERRAHVEGPAGSRLDQREIDGEAEIEPAATGNVAIANEVPLPGA